jgi:hypothetical protein
MKDAFDFEDYSSEELRQALEWKLKDGDLTATEPAKKVALDVLEKASNRPNFGNIGEVDIILSAAKIAYQKRQRGIPLQQRSPDAPFEPEDFDADHDRLNHASANLVKLFDGMVGSESLISKLETWQAVARTSKARRKDPRNLIPTNFVFKGPPGKRPISFALAFFEIPRKGPERLPPPASSGKSTMIWVFSHRLRLSNAPRRIS